MGFYHALSGLNAASQSLDVIGHNIANSATTGFKSSRTEFAEAVASAVGSSNGSASGIGVTTANISQKFTQGNVSPTGRNLDVAINGSGFFVVKQADGSTAYTRSGNFQLDQVGNLRTATGDQVMGYPLDENGAPTSRDLVDMSFPNGKPIAAKATENVTVSLNLDARATNATGDPTATPPVSATSRSTYGTSLPVYDVQGVAIPMNFYFEKAGANTWNMFNGLDNTTSSPRVVSPASGQIINDSVGKIAGLISPINYPDIPAGDVPFTDEAHYPTELTYTFYGPDAGTPPEYAIRTLSYTGAATDIWDFTYDATDPTKITSATLKQDLAGLFPDADKLAAGKAAPQAFNAELTVSSSPANPNSSATAGGTPNDPNFKVTVNLDNITQYGTQFAVSDLVGDGYHSGILNDISISKDGSIVAMYSNGVARAEAKLALSDFRNPQGLQAIGENKWAWTPEAGSIITATAGTGTLGTLQAGALEESNVDLTAELVNMMTAQRAYQANAQAIKTQDQVFSTLVNLR